MKKIIYFLFVCVGAFYFRQANHIRRGEGIFYG